MKKFIKISCLITIYVAMAVVTAKAAPEKNNTREENRENFPRFSFFEEIKPAITELLEKRNPLKTLVVFPLETVMIRPKEEGFKKQDNNYTSLGMKAFQKILVSQRIYLNEVILVEYENELTDSSLPDLIGLIQEKKAPIIVITSNLSGGYNNIPYLELWTLNLLKKFKIDITKGVFSKKSLVLNNLKEIKGTYPTFYKGLLSCNSDRGENAYHQVLATFLANTSFSPDTIIMVHSDINSLATASLQFKALRSDTEFIGVLYDPIVRESNSLSPREYLAFMTEFAKKVNIVKRKIEKTKVDNPYEEE